MFSGEKKWVAVITPGTKALWKGPCVRWLAVHGCFIVVLLTVGPCATWHMPTYVLVRVELREFVWKIILFLASISGRSFLYLVSCFYLVVLFFCSLGACYGYASMLVMEASSLLKGRKSLCCSGTAFGPILCCHEFSFTSGSLFFFFYNCKLWSNWARMVVALFHKG